MSDDGLVTPSTFQPPPLLEHDGNHIVLDGGAPDPLEAGFLLVAGVLAPVPRRVRLPHEDEDADAPVS